ncbi:MAG: hypothetical protein M3Z83_02750 [Actinomycetota bacterium]|nr:hypothetical protein [Actinomycetota bacterium]
MSDDDQRRRILTAVATGEVSPEEAADALDALSADDGPGPADEVPVSAPSDLSRVRVVANARAVRIVGDPGVREAVADGPHELHRDGDTLVVEGESDDPEGAGAFFSSGPGWSVRGRVGRGSRALTVRMHPSLALDAEVNSGSLVVREVRGPIRAEVAAGSARISGFAAPLDLEVSAGRVDASGVLDRGTSRIRCHAGRLSLRLDRGSSVTITGRATVGRLVLPGDGPGVARRRRHSPFDDSHAAVVGEGVGTLDLEVDTGTAVVRAEAS